MNIALLHYSCPPVVGGVEEVIRQQANLFFRYFNNVKIFAGNGKQFTDHIPVEINPLLGSRNPEIEEAHDLLKNNKDDSLIMRYKKDIYRYLKDSLKNFNLLIVHNVLSMPYNLPLTLALWELAQNKVIPIVSWNHDSPYFYENYGTFLDQEPWLILKKCNPSIKYVTISNVRKKQFTKLYNSQCKIEVVPNGIDPVQFWRLDPITVRLIQEEELFKSELLLVQPSRLHPRKNIELSIKVTKAIQEKGVHARFLLTGAYDPHESKTIEYYKKLKKLASELKVENDILIMAEYMFKSGEKLSPDRITIRDLYLIGDVLFMPSFQEGFGIPLLEAGMIKMPIVCSDIPPFKEIGSENVRYFTHNDTPEQIAEMILDFVSQLETARHFKKVMNEFTWDNIFFKKLKPLIKEISDIQ